MPTTGATTKKTWLHLWVGVCYLAWTLSDVGAEDVISENADDSIGALGEVEKWESASQRIFGVGESDSRCGAADRSGCTCINGDCGCCLEIKLPKISLGNCCVNVSLLRENFGLKVTFSLNGRVLYEHEVSARDPPPLCLRIPVPVIKHAASACIKFYDLRREDKTMCGCIQLDIKVALAKVATFKIGCFGIPIGDGEEAERRADLIVRSFMDAAQVESKWKDSYA